MGWGAVIFLTFALLTLGIFGAFVSGFGCENVQPATARAEVCASMTDEGSPRWWMFVCAPAFVFAAVAVVGRRRGPLEYLWVAICAALVAVDAILIAIVTGNL